MEGRKLEIAGRREEEPAPPATYRQVPEEEELEERGLLARNAAGGRNGRPEADGADERMLQGDDGISQGAAAGDVRFTAAAATKEKQNGDAKLDIGEAKSTFVGMGKEELMRYANDPFWVRLRWTLFILFWLLWAAMLVGAVVIIVGAPKCPRPQPRTWWEQGPLTEVEPDKVTAEDLRGLKEAGVKGVIADFPLDTYRGVEASPEFVGFLKSALSAEMPVVVGLRPASSAWFFNESEAREDGYDAYYVWRDPGAPAENGAVSPPNNWVSPDNRSSWTYSERRRQFYYAPLGRPHLDLYSAAVRALFGRVLAGFLGAGAGGVRVAGAPHLLYDETLADEGPAGTAAFTVGQYGFYAHAGRTADHPRLGPLLLAPWRGAVANATRGGPLLVAEDLTATAPYEGEDGTLAVDLPGSSRGFSSGGVVSAEGLAADVGATLGLSERRWPLWKLRNDTGLDDDVLDIIAFTLPGSVLIPYNHTVSRELLKRRSTPSLAHGSFEQFVVANRTVYAFLRAISGNPGYLVAVNPTAVDATVDFPRDTGGAVPDEVTVDLLSGNYNRNYNATGDGVAFRTNVKMRADAVRIPAGAAVVMTYQPKAKEA